MINEALLESMHLATKARNTDQIKRLARIMEIVDEEGFEDYPRTESSPNSTVHTTPEHTNGVVHADPELTPPTTAKQLKLRPLQAALVTRLEAAAPSLVSYDTLQTGYFPRSDNPRKALTQMVHRVNEKLDEMTPPKKIVSVINRGYRIITQH